MDLRLTPNPLMQLPPKGLFRYEVATTIKLNLLLQKCTFYLVIPTLQKKHENNHSTSYELRYIYSSNIKPSIPCFIIHFSFNLAFI